MEKSKIDLENFDLKEAVLEGQCKPRGNTMAKILLQDDSLELQVEDEIGALEKSYILVWNKHLSDCIVIQEIDFVDDSVKLGHLISNLSSALKSATSFKYGRVCLALQWENEYAIVYLRSINQGGNYIGYFQGVTFYYSEADLLSVKCLDQSEYAKEVAGVTITEIKVSDSYIHFSTIVHSLNPEDVLWKMISKTDEAPLTDMKISVCREQRSDQPQAQSATISLDLSDITPDDYDVFALAAFYSEYKLNVDLSQECEDDEHVWSQIYRAGNSTGCEFCLYKDKDGQPAVRIMGKSYPYMFSIVMAVYNTERFLSEAIESVLAQNVENLEPYIIGKEGMNEDTHSFREIYEIILVDDGSTDTSGQICDEYAAAYENIRVIHKENGGVSSARNAGIPMASGKYLNFLDSDDKFSANVLETTFLFFEKHYDEIDVVTFPIKFFDAQTGDHWLNGKFSKSNRILDLLKEPDNSLLFVNASIFKAESVQNQIWFDENLQTGEDMKFIYTLFFSKEPKIGLLDQCEYWYRRRGIGEPSAIQDSKENINYYTSYLSDCLKWLAENSIDRLGFIPQYVQYVIAQQLQWRYVEDRDASIAKRILTDDEFDQYKDLLTSLLKYIDIDIILRQKRLFREQKNFILANKLNCGPDKIFTDDDISYFYDGRSIGTASSNYIRLEFFKILDNELYLEGYSMSLEERPEFFICINGEFFSIKSEARDKNIYSLGEPILFSTTFIYKKKLEDNTPEYNIEFYEKIDGHFIKKREIRYGKTMPFTKEYRKSYYSSEGWYGRLENNGIRIKNLSFSNDKVELNNLILAEQYETQFQEELKKNGKKEAIIKLRQESLSRISCYQQMPHNKIWLISDRVDMAGDNGEALFLYLMKNPDPEVDVYFVINADCLDYHRLKKEGKIIIQNSREHKIMHLLADCIISSQANEYVIDPFFHEHNTGVFRDQLANKNFVFLQHGIIKDDLSDWLNRYQKNMAGFVTSAKPEWQSILDYDYFYSEKEVWLTGLPRHDRLYRDEKRYITIMPTWRKYLSDSSDVDEDITVVKNNFTDSEFYKFYNLLLNDERLLSEATATGYTICFMPHPTLMNDLEKFDHDPRVKFFGKEKPYREIYAESNLVMTDYSSSVMDFAYLRKPVVYCQFDQEEFFAGDHIYVKGYFDYEQNGFGEVTYDLEHLINVMIEYMQNDCKLKDVYKKRMDDFFAFNDKNNCERVYKKLKSL